jgi:dihydroorotase
VPQTTTLEALAGKRAIAAGKSHVNYAFFFGATNDNTPLFDQLDPHSVPGIKLFMGSSTGNMLVDGDDALNTVFSACSRLQLPIMAHCEDTAEINRNMTAARQRFGDDPPVWMHPMIRSTEACLNSTLKAIQLAVIHNAKLHIAHVSTAEEVELLPGVITAEATVGHLCFSMTDYENLGTRIKVNPAIKSCRDMIALRQAVADGRITTVATDHAPHLLSQKQGGCSRAASGMPLIQFSLPLMLGLVDEGVLTLPRLVQLMCHNPAQLFGVRQRGFLRPGYKADVTIVRRADSPWTMTQELILSRCGWSPLEGRQLQWRVEHTLCNGHLVYTDGHVDTTYTGQAVDFR